MIRAAFGWLLSLFRRREVLPNPADDDRSSIEQFRRSIKP